MAERSAYEPEALSAGADAFLNKARIAADLIPLIERLFGPRMAPIEIELVS